MGDIDKLKICVDRDTCIGDGLCAAEAPETFEMDDENIAVVKEGSTEDRQTIVDAACCCPVYAIVVEDTESGEKLAPE